MPSFPNKKGLTQARASKNPPPTKIPTSESPQPVGSRKDAHKKPTTIPGNVITSGMILWSQSIQATTRNTDTNPAYTIVGHVRPNRQATRRYPRPLANSIMGYLDGIPAWQARHLPSSQMKLKRGTLSYQHICLPQCGHADRGATTDCPVGTLCTQTVKKLPMIVPRIKTLGQTIQ